MKQIVLRLILIVKLPDGLIYFEFLEVDVFLIKVKLYLLLITLFTAGCGTMNVFGTKRTIGGQEVNETKLINPEIASIDRAIMYQGNQCENYYSDGRASKESCKKLYELQKLRGHLLSNSLEAQRKKNSIAESAIELGKKSSWDWPSIGLSVALAMFFWL